MPGLFRRRGDVRSEASARRQLEDLDRGCVPGIDLDEPRFAVVLDVIDPEQSDQRKCRAQGIT